MPYRGDAPPEATITITLALDGSSKGNAHMTAGAGTSGSANAKSCVVAPNGKGTVKVRTPKKGILQVVVDFSGASDTGQLDLSGPANWADGDPIDRDPTSWTYSVR
jgi:hypothetical protein